MNRFAPVKKQTKRPTTVGKHPVASKALKSKPRMKTIKKSLATTTSSTRAFSSTMTPLTKQQTPSTQQSLASLPTLDAFKSPLAFSPSTTSLPSQRKFNHPLNQSFKTQQRLFKSTHAQRGLFDPLVRAYKEQSYESPQSKAIKDLPPLGCTIPLKRSNDEWELCYDGTLGRTLIYLKKMSLTSLVLSIVSCPAIVTFPSDNISLAGKWVLALSSILLGVGSTVFTNIFCSAYVCKAFINKKHPNIIEFTTAGFTGKFEAFRFDVTEGTTNNVERPLTSFKHLETDRHFFVAPQMISHPVWGMILPHLFDVEGDEEAEDATAAAEVEKNKVPGEEQEDVVKTEEGAVEGTEGATALEGTEAVATDAATSTEETTEAKTIETEEAAAVIEEAKVTTEQVKEKEAEVKVKESEVKVKEAEVKEAAAPTPTKPSQKVVDAAVEHVTAKAEATATEAIKTAVPTTPIDAAAPVAAPAAPTIAPPAEQKH